MLFNSYPFLFLYLPSVLFGFYFLAKIKLVELSKLWLLLASLGFYGYWDVRFVPLLLLSIFFNYLVGSLIFSTEDLLKKKCVLFLGIGLDLLLLFYFKYINFFLETLSIITHKETQFFDIALPLGISFFTFTQIAYLVDSYRGNTKKGSLLNYSLFVTIFPHLIAGPILHHKEMIGQFKALRMFVVSPKNIAEGLFLFTLGLFKKVMIADLLADAVAPIFDNSFGLTSFFPAWFSAICYSLQLYFDFSGYSDMAVGLGLLFNLRLPINFNSPYQADSIIDFWRRWHITLSLFLRDYLYIPLGGNRAGEGQKLRNLLLTMILGGLWHGAGNTFLVWGACHGSYLVINHLYRKLGFSIPNYFSKALTLFAVIVAWVVFRSPSMDKAFEIIAGMFGFNGIALPLSLEESMTFLGKFGVVFAPIWQLNYHAYQVAMVLLLIPMVLILPNSHFWAKQFCKKPKAAGALCAVMAIICVLNFERVSEFLYYQF